MRARLARADPLGRRGCGGRSDRHRLPRHPRGRPAAARLPSTCRCSTRSRLNDSKKVWIIERVPAGNRQDRWRARDGEDAGLIGRPGPSTAQASVCAPPRGHVRAARLEIGGGFGEVWRPDLRRRPRRRRRQATPPGTGSRRPARLEPDWTQSSSYCRSAGSGLERARGAARLRLDAPTVNISRRRAYAR
jgi:hypothetical protein